MTKKAIAKDFTKGNIPIQLLWLTLPFMASNALQVLYSTRICFRDLSYMSAWFLSLKIYRYFKAGKHHNTKCCNCRNQCYNSN